MEDSKKKKLGIILVVIIVISGISIGIGIYFTLNFANEERPEGTIIDTATFKEMSGSGDLDCRGNVDLIQISGGGYVLYFHGMTVDSGPNKIYMSQETSFTTQFDSLGVNAEVGDLPYRYGNFSVAVPASVNPLSYNTVVFSHAISNAILGYARF